LLLLVMVVGAQESKQLICLFGGSSALRTHMELRLVLQLLGGDEQIIEYKFYILPCGVLCFFASF